MKKTRIYKGWTNPSFMIGKSTHIIWRTKKYWIENKIVPIKVMVVVKVIK